jgi:uncharacterized protein YidB (DUF937 family)
MGILGSIENMATQEMSGQGMSSKDMSSKEQQSKVAGGFVQAVQEHPGGLQGMLDHLRQNGMGQQVQQWGSGQPQATPEQVQNGLNGTGLIEKTAEKAGISPEVAKIGLAVVLPMLIAHMAPNGQAPQGGLGSMAGSFLSRFL